MASARAASATPVLPAGGSLPCRANCCLLRVCCSYQRPISCLPRHCALSLLLQAYMLRLPADAGDCTICLFTALRSLERRLEGKRGSTASNIGLACLKPTLKGGVRGSAVSPS